MGLVIRSIEGQKGSACLGDAWSINVIRGGVESSLEIFPKEDYPDLQAAFVQGQKGSACNNSAIFVRSGGRLVKAIPILDKNYFRAYF